MEGLCAKFIMRTSWMEYALSISDPEVRDNFNVAVMMYAIDRIVMDKSKLYGKPRTYFNRVVKPDIDRQHKRMQKGLELL